jgi:hypothetical protein
LTDVSQRLRAIQEEPHTRYPDEQLKEGCLNIYEKEKAAGTELTAIIGALQEHIEMEEERIRKEREHSRRAQLQEEKEAAEQRFRSGADCKWLSLGNPKELYCRINGRTYRLSPTSDKMWYLHRIAPEHKDAEILIGKYSSRGATRKVLEQVAYLPEPMR